jgi:hypothetical protein
MKRNLGQTLWIIIFALCLSSSSLILAQTQNSPTTSSEAKRSDLTLRVRVQLLVASNIANAKTDYPTSLEALIKQLKSSLAFKNHYLVATYLYNVADGGAFEVSDVTYVPLEQGGGLSPTFFNLGISGIKLNANSDSVHISRFRFEARKRIFIQNATGEGGTAKPVFDSVATGITTELNLSDGTPTIVGTTTSALSDGVLVIVVTVDHSGVR